MCPSVGQKDEPLHNKMTIALTGLAAGLLVASAVALAPPGTLVLTLGLGALLLALSFIDIRTLTLPDPLTAATVLLGILMVWLTRPGAWQPHLIGGLVGYGVLVAVELGYRKLRGRDGLGRGDAKLLGALGVWTGWAGLAPIMLVASASALVGVLGLTILGLRRTDADTPIPFGPFIALGGWVVWLGGRFLLPTGLY
jgi:leader peptidase (prepilin peptidase) / N-methyltransferase